MSRGKSCPSCMAIKFMVQKSCGAANVSPVVPPGRSFDDGEAVLKFGRSLCQLRQMLVSIISAIARDFALQELSVVLIFSVDLFFHSLPSHRLL